MGEKIDILQEKYMKSGTNVLYLTRIKKKTNNIAMATHGMPRFSPIGKSDISGFDRKIPT